MIESKGDQFGFRIVNRGTNDSHALLEIISEDDEKWHKSMDFSSFWIDDLIEQLQKAKTLLESDAFEDDVYSNGTFGRKFKGSK